MSDRLVLLLVTYATLGAIALMARYLAFADRPDLRSLAWGPMLCVAVIVTPFVLWAN